MLDQATTSVPDDNLGGDAADSQWRGQRVDCVHPKAPHLVEYGSTRAVGLPHVIDVSEAKAKPNGIDRAASEEGRPPSRHCSVRT